MPGPRYVVIVNPRSQAGALGRKWSYIATQLRRELGAFEDVLTQAPGDATRLTREAIDGGADVVVAIGGDGTINEVMNGFFEHGEPVPTSAALGVLPFGTGGDFRRTIKLTKELEQSTRVLRAGRRRRIDVGRLDYTTPAGDLATRMFINISSFGISGLVDDYVNRASTKFLGGRVSFALASVRAAFAFTPQRVQLIFDDDETATVERTINTVAVANGCYFGGGMFIAPNAELDDGKFDVVMLGDLTAKEMTLNGFRLYSGTHLGLPKVEVRRASKLTARPLGGEPVRLDCDGETPGHLPATFSLLPQALDVVVP